ncbi:unnamed protein product [Bemisia tabaci]|nr:unnamed protein product [Bemisia tabaci]
MLLSYFNSENTFLTDSKKHCCETSRAKDFYFHVLAKVKEAVITNKVDHFERLCDVVEYTNNENITKKEFLNDEENPFFDTNLIILSCKHNSPSVLKYLFQSNCKVLSILAPETSAIDAYHPDLVDSEQHNAFYYAIRSDSIDVLSTLIHEWPGMNFTSNPRKLEQLLSAAYDELKLKRVPLSDEMETFVESKLIDLKFWSENSLSVKDSESDTNNIIARIKLMIEKIQFLKKEYSRADVDDVFLLTGKFILQNMHVLKRQLRSTYNILPWEEVEFCLVSFISSRIKYHEMNLLTVLSLNKESIIYYLEIFGKKLDEVVLVEGYFNNNDFNILPKTPRDEVVAQIIESNPEFRDLYDDYKKVRDIYSLETIRVHLEFIAEANFKEKEGQLTMTRALQVIGEQFKNTLESPKLSTTMSELLLSSLPLSTKKIIVDLRDALSHSSSLSQRTEIEQQADDNFYDGIRNDAKIIESLVVDILLNNKVECLKSLLRKIISATCLDDLRKMAKPFDKVNVCPALPSEKSEMVTNKKLERMVEALRKNVTDPNDIEEQLFREIDNIIKSFKTQSEVAIFDYYVTLGSVITGLITLEENKMQSDFFRKFQSSVTYQFKKITSEVKECDLQDIIQRGMIICASVKSRIEPKTQKEIERLNDIHMLACKFFCFAEIKSNDIKWLEKLREQLLIKKRSSRPSQKQGGTPEGTKPKSEDALSLKLHELQIILKNNDLGGETVEILTSFKKQQKLQPVVEMLLLDIMSILSRSMKPWENNLFFFDDCAPLLNGKFLRDHLAHGDISADLLSYDPSMAIFLNAKKFSGIEDFSKITKKIGKFIVDIPSLVQARHDQKLAIISTQENLFSALAEGNLEAVRTCLRKGADMNARNIKGQTATHFACMGSNLDVLKFTFEQTSNSDLRDVMGQTPLHVAAKYGNSGIIKYLLERDLQVDAPDNFRNTPLHVAAKCGQDEAIKILLMKDASTFDRDQHTLTAVHYAIRCNMIDVAKILLEREENVDSNECSSGFTPLHIAAEFGCLEIVNFLLSKKADVHKTTEYGWVPLHAAAFYGHLEVVEALIRRGAGVNVRIVNGSTPLHFAVENGHERVARTLLQSGADPNISDKQKGHTPLHNAALLGHEGIAHVLLENGANAKATTFLGGTPLHFAAMKGHLKIAADLLAQNVDIHAKDTSECAPLHYAARQEHTRIVKILIKHGADVNVEGPQGLTSLHLAAKAGHESVMNVLISQKIGINKQDSYGNTALFYAASSGKCNVIEVLLKNKAAVNIANYNGETPVQAALESGCEDCVRILIAKSDLNDSSPELFLIQAIAGNKSHILRYCLENNFQKHSSILKNGLALCLAVGTKNKESIELLIKHGADVNAILDTNTPILPVVQNLMSKFGVDVNTILGGSMPLISAVRINQIDIVKLLLDLGADVNAQKGEPLHRAVLLGRKDIIKVLLDRGARTYFKYEKNKTLLHVAAEKGDENTVKMLINKKAPIKVVTDDNLTPLFSASRNGHEDVVKLLIAKQADVNFASNYGTPLDAALESGHFKVVEILLEHGAEFGSEDNRNKTPFEIAIKCGNFERAKTLLQQNDIEINVENSDGETLLHTASEEGNVEVVKFLVDNGADVNARNHKAAHMAAGETMKNISEFLLAFSGVKLPKSGPDQLTPLHYAAVCGNLEVVDYLIGHGADVNCEATTTGSRPIHLAAASGRKEIVEALIINGAIYNPVDFLGKTPLEITAFQDTQILLKSIENLFVSVRKNNVVQVKKLIRNKVVVNARCSNYSTPLHYAAWKGYTDVIECLLENGADPNSVNDKGFTPLHYASKYSQFEGTVALLYKGAIYNFTSNNNKTPFDLATDKRVMALLDMIDKAYRNVRSHDTAIISDLRGITDEKMVKAIMRARCMKKESLVVAAINGNFPEIEALKQIFQEHILLTVPIEPCSIPMLQRILNRRRDIFGEENPATIDVLFNIARICYSEGNYSEACRILTDICEKHEKIFIIENKEVLSAKSYLALVWYRLGKNEESLRTFQEIYPKQETLLGRNHPDT